MVLEVDICLAAQQRLDHVLPVVADSQHQRRLAPLHKDSRGVVRLWLMGRTPSIAYVQAAKTSLENDS